MVRDDLIGFERAPKHIEELLIQLGGVNPYGEANFRYVLAQNRVCKQAAEWHDWAKGLSVVERGGLVSDDDGNRVLSPHRPERVIKEMRTIARYPLCECLGGVLSQKKTRVAAGDCEECHGVKGWIVERWWPRHIIAGTQESWYSHKVPGTDLPRLGPYPEHGIFRRIAQSKATERIPNPSQISELIGFIQYCNFNSQLTPEQFAKELQASREAVIEREKRKEDERNRELMKEALDPMVGSSLSAGREREKYAKRMRERGIPIGHVGS